MSGFWALQMYRTDYCFVLFLFVSSCIYCSVSQNKKYPLLILTFDIAIISLPITGYEGSQKTVRDLCFSFSLARVEI